MQSAARVKPLEFMLFQDTSPLRPHVYAPPVVDAGAPSPLLWIISRLLTYPHHHRFHLPCARSLACKVPRLAFHTSNTIDGMPAQPIYISKFHGEIEGVSTNKD